MGDLMAERTCFNCLYCICDPCLWLRWLDEGESIVPQCAHHPRWPGRLHDVPGVPCRNYRPKPVAPHVGVAAADYEWLNQFHWGLSNGYAARRDENNKIIYMHRLILPPPPRMLVDHIDGNKANNCRSNLRIATRTQNMQNRPKHRSSSSRFKGIHYSRWSHKWYATCRYAGQCHRSAYFETDDEAARVYDHLAVAWFGEFARLNFPREWPPERRTQVYAQNEPQRQEADKAKRRRERAQVKRKKVASKGGKPRRARGTRRAEKAREERH
jgi:hypothetical protein